MAKNMSCEQMIHWWHFGAPEQGSQDHKTELVKMFIFDRHISGSGILRTPADNLSAFMEPYKSVAVENALFLEVM